MRGCERRLSAIFKLVLESCTPVCVREILRPRGKDTRDGRDYLRDASAASAARGFPVCAAVREASVWDAAVAPSRRMTRTRSDDQPRSDPRRTHSSLAPPKNIGGAIRPDTAGSRTRPAFLRRITTFAAQPAIDPLRHPSSPPLPAVGPDLARDLCRGQAAAISRPRSKRDAGVT